MIDLSRDVKTPDELKKKLEQNGITCYERNGKLTGVWNEKGTRKYRLRNLGVNIHQLDRDRSIEKERKRNRDIHRER